MSDESRKMRLRLEGMLVASRQKNRLALARRVTEIGCQIYMDLQRRMPGEPFEAYYELTAILLDKAMEDQ